MVKAEPGWTVATAEVNRIMARHRRRLTPLTPGVIGGSTTSLSPLNPLDPPLVVKAEPG